MDQTRTMGRSVKQNNATVQQCVEHFESSLLKKSDIAENSEQVHHFLNKRNILFYVNEGKQENYSQTKNTFHTRHDCKAQAYPTNSTKRVHFK